MASHTRRAPTVYDGGTLGDLDCRAAFDRQGIAPNLSDIQTKFVERRTRLRPQLAALIAELCFGRAA